MHTPFVAYYRVSTQQQSDSGLGLDAQRAAVSNYVRGRGEVTAEFVEVESGRKGGRDRPQLQTALAQCRKEERTLVIGKLDRLARDVRYFLEVMDDSGVDIRFADLPDVNPKSDEGRMILINMANFAEFEGRRISTRTKAALAAAKARGVRLGTMGPANLRRDIKARQAAADQFAGRLRGVIDGFRAQGLSQRAMVLELNSAGVRAAKGGQWSLAQLQRVLARLPSRD